MKVFIIKVSLDSESGVYFVAESNVPGLHAEADTLDEMRDTIFELAPDLLVANGVIKPRNHDYDVPIELVMRESLKAHRARC
jgi:predicted RNase H-like HicB family nuclease